MTESAERRSFKRLTEDLFEGVVVMYSNRFRTSAIVKRVLDAMDDLEVFGNSDVALSAFKDAWNSRNDFCKLCISIAPFSIQEHGLTAR